MRDRDLIRAYAGTRWSVDLPAGRVELEVGRRADLAGVPLPAAVVTAYNPRSELIPSEENERAQQALRGEIRTTGLPHYPSLAGGTGPDACSWNEPGLLVGAADRLSIVELAARYGQNAVLWIGDDGIPALLATRDGFGGARAGQTLGHHT